MTNAYVELALSDRGCCMLIERQNDFGPRVAHSQSL